MKSSVARVLLREMIPESLQNFVFERLLPLQDTISDFIVAFQIYNKHIDVPGERAIAITSLSLVFIPWAVVYLAVVSSLFTIIFLKACVPSIGPLSSQ